MPDRATVASMSEIRSERATPRMRALLAAVLSLGLAVTAAANSPKDPMANFYANTLVTDHGPNGLFYVYFNPDHTYKVVHDGKIERQGRYTYRHGQLCMEVNGNPKGECPPFKASMRIGETWIATTPSGNKEPLTLKAGRAPLPAH